MGGVRFEKIRDQNVVSCFFLCQGQQCHDCEYTLPILDKSIMKTYYIVLKVTTG